MNSFKSTILGLFLIVCSAHQSIEAEALSDRLADYFNTRDEAAFFQIFEQPDLFDPATGAVTFDIYNYNNGDEQDFSSMNYAASYSKGFEHDPITGLMTDKGVASFLQLKTALVSGLQDDFNKIQLAAGSSKLVGPQTALELSLEGRPIQLFSGFQPAKLRSPEAAAALIENYLMAICRRVSFFEYGTGLNTDSDGQGGSITKRAADILQSLGTAYKGPRDRSTGKVTPAVLFRGNNTGSIPGQYLSQFLLLDVSPLYSNAIARKQYITTPSNREFGVTWNDFIAIEDGGVPRPYEAGDLGALRYAINGADTTVFVHHDGPCEAFYYATQILVGNNFPQSKNLPYFNGSMPKEAAFGSLGVVEIFSILGAVSDEAIKAAWAQKWLAARCLRPEAFAGLVHRVKTTGVNTFGLDASLLRDDILSWVLKHNQKQADPSIITNPGSLLNQADASTYLLGQMFPEASPLHPSFPAAHAVIAGACATVLKAYFEGSTKINSILSLVTPDPADPTQLIPYSGSDANLLTVNSELEKLASNIALARNFAGIHYRADGDLGCELGEQVAIFFLQDQARKHKEEKFTGFSLTKFDGNMIRITKDAITLIS